MMGFKPVDRMVSFNGPTVYTPPYKAAAAASPHRELIPHTCRKEANCPIKFPHDDSRVPPSLFSSHVLESGRLSLDFTLYNISALLHRILFPEGNERLSMLVQPLIRSSVPTAEPVQKFCRIMMLQGKTRDLVATDWRHIMTCMQISNSLDHVTHSNIPRIAATVCSRRQSTGTQGKHTF